MVSSTVIFSGIPAMLYCNPKMAPTYTRTNLIIESSVSKQRPIISKHFTGHPQLLFSFASRHALLQSEIYLYLHQNKFDTDFFVSAQRPIISILLFAKSARSAPPTRWLAILRRDVSDDDRETFDNGCTQHHMPKYSVDLLFGLTWEL